MTNRCTSASSRLSTDWETWPRRMGATVFGGDYQQAVGALAPFRYKVGLPDASDGTCSQCYHAAHWPADHDPIASATLSQEALTVPCLICVHGHDAIGMYIGACTEASRTQVSALMEDIWEYESDPEAGSSVESDADEGDYIIRMLLYQYCELFTLSPQVASANSQT